MANRDKEKLQKELLNESQTVNIDHGRQVWRCWFINECGIMPRQMGQVNSAPSSGSQSSSRAASKSLSS